MRFDKVSTERYISVSNKDVAAGFPKWYFVSVTDDSSFFNGIWGNSGEPNFRITYQGTGNGYSIVNISTGVNIAQLYNTDKTHPQLDLATITDSNFDIESVLDTDTAIRYYRILSREHTSRRYLTYSGSGWKSGEGSATEDPTGHGDLDPLYFEHLLTGNSSKNQYIRFFSITSPHSVYE